MTELPDEFKATKTHHRSDGQCIGLYLARFGRMLNSPLEGRGTPSGGLPVRWMNELPDEFKESKPPSSIRWAIHWIMLAEFE
ncbi:hypothetical protein [Balneola vulgaris]|uniref:hypothetical protein n=1 Tax=Balneola vulgaris TaxID=287535 RepID=UPI00036F5D9A|nr:hypothetical protein [Balneola vulgaris]